MATSPSQFNLPPLLTITSCIPSISNLPDPSKKSPELNDIFNIWDKSAQDGDYEDWSFKPVSPVVPSSRSFSFCFGSPYAGLSSSTESMSSPSMNLCGLPRKRSAPVHTHSPYSPPHSPSSSRHGFSGSHLSTSPDLSQRSGKKFRLNFSKHTTTILKDWLFTNLAHPFPTEQQKMNLSMMTGLSIEQINNWFINGRRRLLTIKKDQNYRKYFKIKN